jgi:hypothetical protein
MQLLSRGGFLRMTEEEWLACDDPQSLLFFVDASARKYRLFGVACARALWPRLSDWRLRRAVEVAELHADGLASEADLHACRSRLASKRRRGATDFVRSATDPSTHLNVRTAATAWTAGCEPFDDPARWEPAERTINAQFAPLVRDLFGNPFRPVILAPEWLRWNDGCVPRIAEGIYQERAFDRLPILHDALLDAGCDNEDVLAHCLAAGPHVRGCWVLDLLINKK